MGSIGKGSLQKVGERCKIARMELNLSQEFFKDLINGEQVQTAISRLESGKGANSEVLIRILNFYSEQGYNLEWFLLEDNSNILKKKDLIYSMDIDKEKLSKAFEKMNESYTSMKKNMAIIQKVVNEI